MTDRSDGGRRRRSTAGDAGDGRGQLALSAVEAAIGVLFVLAVAVVFGVGVPDAGATEAQLDAYASDTATLLVHEPPSRADAASIPTILGSGTTFDRERETVEDRVDRLLPETVLYRVETPHGSVGVEPPTGAAVGRSTVATRNGPITVLVWYV